MENMSWCLLVVGFKCVAFSFHSCALPRGFPTPGPGRGSHPRVSDRAGPLPRGITGLYGSVPWRAVALSLEQDGGRCVGSEVWGNVLATLREGKEMDIGVLLRGESSTLNKPPPDSMSSGRWACRGTKSSHLRRLGLVACEGVPV